MGSVDGIGLVTRADDIGTFRSATAALLDATHNGIVRNASLMAPAPCIEQAAEALTGERGLCFGVHLTMNCEWRTVKWGPVSGVAAVPSLVNEEGHLLQAPLHIHERGAVFEQMLAECQAQLAKLRSLGFEVSYADTHMGFEWLHETDDESRRFDDALRGWAEREGLIYMPPLSRLERPELSSGDPVTDLAAALETAGPGIYLRIGHPCYDDDEMRGQAVRDEPLGVQATARDAQRRQFTDPRVLDVVGRRGIRPMTYIEAGRALGLSVP